LIFCRNNINKNCVNTKKEEKKVKRRRTFEEKKTHIGRKKENENKIKTKYVYIENV